MCQSRKNVKPTQSDERFSEKQILYLEKGVSVCGWFSVPHFHSDLHSPKNESV